MSVESGSSSVPLQYVSRFLQSLRRRFSSGRSSTEQNYGQIPQISSTNTTRSRNRLRRHPSPLTASNPDGHVRAGTRPRLRSFSNTFPSTLGMRNRNSETNFLSSWNSPRLPVHPFTIHLPDDILRQIFEHAAEDLDTASALTLVAFHVRAWVDPILYSRVRLEGLDAIRLFARTIQDTINAENLVREPDDDTMNVPLRRIARSPGFFGCVKSIALLPQEDRVLLFFRDAVRDANLILNSCYGVVELEASGDFLRRTDVSGGALDPPGTANGDAESATGSAEPVSVGPTTPIAVTQGLSEQAPMRPKYLTLVSPTLNVNFRLPILSNVTHLHYSSSLPRNLNFLGTLLALTHLAFDYQLGVATIKTEGLLQLVRTALDWGVPPPVEDLPGDDTHSARSSAAGTSGGEGHQIVDFPSAPRLKMVIVRILLRPRMQDSDRAGEACRKLAHLTQTESRLVHFESQGLFGEDVWETAGARLCARERLSTSWYRDSMSQRSSRCASAKLLDEFLPSLSKIY